jgi:hypothetical protein
MKRQIIPVLFICMVLPWIVSRVFQLQGHQETLHENCQQRFHPEPFTGSNIETSGEWINYEGLSNKQINYLIP